MPNAAAESLKAEGNALFKAGKYADAIVKYKAATAADPSVPAYWYVYMCVCCMHAAASFLDCGMEGIRICVFLCERERNPDTARCMLLEIGSVSCLAIIALVASSSCLLSISSSNLFFG